MADLGVHFGGGLHQREVEFLMEREWARSADDILWRRSKLGLRLNAGQVQALDSFVRAKLAGLLANSAGDDALMRAAG
jgi:glycerol-3-phosphate dehydrogenase